MPKNKKKKHQADTGLTNGQATASGMDVVPKLAEDDTSSVVSSMDGSTYGDYGMTGDDGRMVDDTSSDDQEVIHLEDILLENLDLLSDKSTKNRLSAFAHVDKTFCQKVVTDLLTGRVLGLMEVVNKGLKRAELDVTITVHSTVVTITASGGERCQTARLAMLTSVQLGTEFDLVSTKPILSAVMADRNVSAMERAMCFTALGFCMFMASEDSLEVVKVMEEYEAYYNDSRLHADIIVAAIHSWCLLLTVAPSVFVRRLVERQFPVLQALLASDATSVKIATGQAISLLVEIARDHDMDVDSECIELADVLQEMAADSNRYKGRKDRTQQRSCFRDFVQTVEDGTVPEKQIKVGSETLQLDTWSRIVQYGAFRELLGNGLHTHLQSNELVREVFGMGPIPVVTTADRHMEKMEKKYYNAMYSKMRTQARSKQRDKRSDFA